MRNLIHALEVMPAKAASNVSLKKISAAALLSAVLLGLFAVDGFSASRISSASGNWSSPATWGGNTPPGPADDVIINGNFSVIEDLPSASCLTLQLGGSTLGTGSGTLTFASGSQLTVPALVVIGVTNNTPGSINMAAGGTLVCQGFNLTRLGTWTQGTGTIELTSTNTLPSNTNVNFNNLRVSGGTTILSRALTIAGSLVITAGGALDCQSFVLTTTGDIANDGTFTGGTGSVTFARNGNQTLSGAGLNNFTAIRLNMGASISNTLEITATNFAAPDGFLTLSSGTLKVSGSFPLTNTFFVGPLYNIPPMAGFWLNNPNVTVTAQDGPVSLRGSLRVTAGTYNIGTQADTSLTYQNTGSSILIEGGVLNVAGRICGNNATATSSYTQSGGIVSVATRGSTDPVFGGFDLNVVGSSFSMSGGTIVVRNATSAPADLFIGAGAGTVTGGLIQIGDALTANAQVIRVRSSRTLGNFLVSNATAQATKPTAQLAATGLNLVGNFTLQAGTALDAGGLNVSLGGDWVNSGTITNENTVQFNGAGAQGMSNTSGETFNRLSVNKAGGALTLNNSASVTASFNLLLGTLAVNTSTLTLNSTVTGGGVLTSASAGTVNYNQGSAGQSVLAGNYGNLTFSNFSKILPVAGTVGVAGTFSPGTAVGHTVTGSTLDFNGASQPMPGFAYNNLIASGSGVKTASGTLTVAGNFTNNPGVTIQGATLLTLNGTTHSNGGTLSAASLVVGAGGNLANTGVATVSTSLGGAGTLTQGATGTLNLGGTAGISSLVASAAGNTVNYTGAGQVVTPTSYHHLALSGSGTPDLTGLATVNGDFSVSGTVTAVAAGGLTIGGSVSIVPGASFDAVSFAHVVKGNWNNSGVFVPGTGSVTLSGAGSQSLNGGPFNNLTLANASGAAMLGDLTVGASLALSSGAFSIGAHALTLNGNLSLAGGTLSGGTTSSLVVSGASGGLTLPALTLSNLTLNRAAGAALGGDIAVNGALTISTGQLSTGVNTVNLGPSGSVSETAGQLVLGNLSTTRNVTATSGVELFGNVGADLALNGVAPGATTVLRRTGGASSGAGHSSIKRNFDIAPTVNTGLNAGLTLHYDASELNSQDGAALELYRSRDNGATWSDLGGTASAVGRTISATGLNDLSRWTASDTSNRIGSAPTALTTSISPAAKNVGDPGFTLTVNGSEFVHGKATVRFNGSNRTTTFVNSSQLTAAIPASDVVAVGTFPVTVVNTGGATSNAQNLTVNPLQASKVRVETAADGSGSVVAAQSLASGSALTVFAVTRDVLNNFVANVAASSWAAENLTGGVVAGDLVPSVDGKSAVFTGHVAGTTDIKALSGPLTPTPSGLVTVIPGAATKVRVETAANGSGGLVPAQSLASGASVTGFAVTRDASNNFVANVAASAWSLSGVSGGVVAGDLVPALDARSAVFTGHLVGSASLNAASSVLAATGSGVLTVTPGVAARVRVETAAGGSGTVVPAQGLASGSSLTGFAVTRDALNNFVANVAATWSLGGVTGGVVAGDLVPSGDGKSAVFSAHVTGSTTINAVSGVLPATNSGLITVGVGTATQVRVETAANGSGTLVPAQSLTSGSSLTGFAVTRDVSNNFVANVAASAWSLSGVSGGVVVGDLVPAVDGKSAVFTGHGVGSASLAAASGALLSVASGAVTVTPGLAIRVAVETAANGSGAVVPAQGLVSGASITGFAVTRDVAGNFVANVAASSWSLAGVTGGVVSADLLPALDAKSAVFTGHGAGSASISAASGALPSTSSGTITVGVGPATQVRVETAANGTGTIVPTQSVGVGSTVTVYAITRDASNNFVANVAATAWSMGSLSGGVVAGDLVPVAGNKSAVFTGHVAGSGSISASSAALPVTPSGIITVSGAVGVEVGGQPLHFELMQNSPNPFHGFTTIRYELPAAAALSIKVFDVNGREVATILEGNETAGRHSLRWDASVLRSGMYFYRMDSNGRRGVRKMLVAR